MKEKKVQVKTRLEESLIDEINKSGYSLYSFIQLAVKEKINNDKLQKEKIELADILNLEFKKLQSDIQDDLVKIYKVNYDAAETTKNLIKEFTESLSIKDEKSKESYKKILQNISDKLGRE